MLLSKERGAAVGTWAAASGISAVLGQILGGFLIDTISWRVGFFVNVPPEPLVPLHLFGSRNFSGANIMTFLLYAGFGRALFLLPIVLIEVHGYSATAATGALVPFAGITFVMGRWAGGLVTRYGEKLPLMVGRPTNGEIARAGDARVPRAGNVR